MKINERIIKISERKKVDFLGFIQYGVYAVQLITDSKNTTGSP